MKVVQSMIYFQPIQFSILRSLKKNFHCVFLDANTGDAKV